MSSSLELRRLAEAKLGRPIPDAHWTPEARAAWQWQLHLSALRERQSAQLDVDHLR